MSSAQVHRQHRFSPPRTSTDGNNNASSSACHYTSCTSPSMRSQHSQSFSAMTMPDISTLTIGMVPELVLASKANDHLMAQSPPTYHYSPSGTSTSLTPTSAPTPTSNHNGSPRDRRRSGDEVGARTTTGFDVRDLGAMMSSYDVPSIEEYTPHLYHKQHTEEPVHGIDGPHHHHHQPHRHPAPQQRPIIGISRPSDEGEREDKRRLVQEWTTHSGESMTTSPTKSRRTMQILTPRSQESKPIDPARKKTVDFTPTTPTHLSDRYCLAPARNSSFASTSSSHSSSNTPIIYSPPEESPPLHSNEYAGTILDLVTDPEEIREYRQLERKKESIARRKNSTTSSAGSSGSSGGSTVARKSRRSGSISWGRNICVGEQEEKERLPTRTYRQQSMNACPSSSSYSPSWSRQSYPHRHSHPHSSHPTYANGGVLGRRTTVSDVSTNGNLAYFETDSRNGVRQPFSAEQPQERMRDIPTSPSTRFVRIDTDHASNGLARREERDSTGEHVSSNSSSTISPTMPSANIHVSPPGAAPATTNKPLFHPDLHPVADHHASANNNTHRIDTNDLKCEMPTKWSSSSLPADAMFTLTQSSSTGDSSSPSSGGTIRPSLVGDEGKPKAYTVADYRTLDEEWMA